MSNLIRFFFTLSVLLLPFSTYAGGGQYVISFAMPFLVVFFFLECFFILFKRLSFARHLSAQYVIYFLYAIYASYACLFSLTPLVSLSRAIINLVGFIIFMYIIHVVFMSQDRQKAYNYFLRIFFYFGILLAMYFIANIFIQAYQHSMLAVFSSRGGGRSYMSIGWGTSNTVAATLLLTLPIARLYYIRINGKSSGFFVYLILFAIFLTLSRNAIISSLGFLIFSSLNRKNYKNLIFLIIISLGCLYALECFFPAVFASRNSTIFNFNGRTELWSQGLNVIGDQFWQLLFVPSAGFYGCLSKYGYSFHNVLLTTMIEQGLIGLILLILVYVSPVFTFFRCCLANKREMKILSLGLLFGLLDLMFEDVNFLTPYMLCTWALFGLFYASLFLSNDPLRGACV